MAFGKNWMEKKKIEVNHIKDGKKIVSRVTVAKFIEMYNTQNEVFTRTTEIAQNAMVALYRIAPDNDFFDGAGDAIIKFCKGVMAREKIEQETPKVKDNITNIKDAPKEEEF